MLEYSLVRDDNLCCLRVPNLSSIATMRHGSIRRTVAKVGCCTLRPACGCRGVHGEFHVGLRCCSNMFSSKRRIICSRGCLRRRASRRSRKRTGRLLRRAHQSGSKSPYSTFRVGRVSELSVTPASWCSVHLGTVDSFAVYPWPGALVRRLFSWPRSSTRTFG